MRKPDLLPTLYLDVFNNFSDGIKSSVQNFVNRGYKNFSLDVSALALYCITLLRNNGWSDMEMSEDILNFMRDAVIAPTFYFMGINADCSWEINSTTSFILLITIN